MSLPENYELYEITVGGSLIVLAPSISAAELVAEGLSGFDLRDVIEFSARKINVESKWEIENITGPEIGNSLPWVDDASSDNPDDLTVRAIFLLLKERAAKHKQHQEFLKKQGDLFNGYPKQNGE